MEKVKSGTMDAKEIEVRLRPCSGHHGEEQRRGSRDGPEEGLQGRVEKREVSGRREALTPQVRAEEGKGMEAEQPRLHSLQPPPCDSCSQLLQFRSSALTTPRAAKLLRQQGLPLKV